MTARAPAESASQPTSLDQALPGLDTLRAIASILVVATHTCFWAGVYGAGLLGAMTQRFEVGVAIFFVLSGYLLSRPWFAHAAGGRRRDSTGRYFVKRLLRVMPVYWVSMATALTVLPENQDLSWQRWIENALLIDLFTHDNLPHGLTQMWSLSTEVMFYLALPVLMLLVIHRGRWSPAFTVTTLTVLCLSSFIWIGSTHVNPGEANAWLTRGLFSYLTWFAINRPAANQVR